MKLFLNSILTTAVTVLVSAGSVQAETKVTLKGVHNCCTKCSDAITKSLSKVEGATVKINDDRTTVTVTAPDDAIAGKALAAIGRAGFYGTSDHKKLKIRSAGDTKRKGKGKEKAPEQPKVSRVQLTGLHNCCAKCCKAIKEAIGSVEGVEADTAKPNERSVVVEGNFSVVAVIRALNKAGFNARPAGDRKKKGDKKKAE